jgi:beta-glucanase (GH16 family)
MILKKIYLAAIMSSIFWVSCISKKPDDKLIIDPDNHDEPVSYDSLIWADEFNDKSGLNTSIWTYEIGNGYNGWGNNELQYYTDRTENISVDTGYLRITAKREDYEGYQFTSSRIITADKYELTYGKVVIRAKLPFGTGTWPALWMLGGSISTIGWPACGEIDIMEHVGKNQNRIHGSLHNALHYGGNSKSGSTYVSNVSDEFHEYIVVWSPKYIAFYADTRQYYSYTIETGDPYNSPFFFIMNIAMGGNWGGDVDPEYSESSMFVDYIRVYR